MMGDMLLVMRLPGAMELAIPGCGSKMFIVLFRNMPVPGTVAFEPKGGVDGVRGGDDVALCVRGRHVRGGAGLRHIARFDAAFAAHAAHAGDIETSQYVQHLDDMDAAGGGRRQADDVETAIGAANDMLAMRGVDIARLADIRAREAFGHGAR